MKALHQSVAASLAPKLDEFSQVLTPEERILMLGLLGLAGAALKATGDVATTGKERAVVRLRGDEVPSLSSVLEHTLKPTTATSPPNLADERTGDLRVDLICDNAQSPYKLHMDLICMESPPNDDAKLRINLICVGDGDPENNNLRVEMTCISCVAWTQE